MKIVVLDGYTLNPGDLSWDAIEALGDCEVHERTSPEELLTRARGAEVLFTNKTTLNAETLGQLPDCRYIGVLATGYNVVDIDAAAQHGIAVTNVPEYGTGAVAQMVFAHVLHLYSRVAEHSVSVRAGDWAHSKDFCYWNAPLLDLQGKTMGIVGLGKIGSAVARAAQAFDMRVLASTRSRPANAPEGVLLASLEQVFEESDIVSLHCPLTIENAGFVNAALMSRMKSSALLINTSRGLLIDEPALAAALDDGVIAGAGLDVLSMEPPPADHPLLSAKNCVITPHIAWATYGARRRLMAQAAENLRGFLAGDSMNLVNSPRA